MIKKLRTESIVILTKVIDILDRIRNILIGDNKLSFDLRYEEMFPHSFKSRKLSDYRYVKKKLTSGELVFESDNSDEIDEYLLDIMFMEELKR